ncbi:MAG: YjbQ family protein [Chloroflexi bacterium]|nr:YjbQ family protein [Chloroflexota bacterium]
MLTQLEVATKSRAQLIDISERIEQAVQEAKIGEGVLYLFVPHTTAGILINENYDPSVAQDILDFLEKLAPRQGKYKHTEGNADSHIKTAVVGSSAIVPIQKGKLALGTWQGIFLCEFDGPRQRKVFLQLMDEGR